MIKSLHIENFKGYRSFDFELNPELNIVVGNNEERKSTLLEAINLALTRKLGSRAIDQELSPYLFNRAAADAYLTEIAAGKAAVPPRILIEVYLNDLPALAPLRGSNNSRKEDCPGLSLEILFDEDYKEEYADLLKKKENVRVVPAEYYRVNWLSFANKAVTSRGLAISVFYIDATTIRLQSGTDYYIQNLIAEGLSAKEKVALAVEYRKLKEAFSDQPSIGRINKDLATSAISQKPLTVDLDISQRTNWETNLVPHLDRLPFHLSGKGEQTALKIMLALGRKADACNVVLVEEPENHLSFTSMSMLLDTIVKKCAGKQIVATTHSAYVLNKLGIDKVTLLAGGNRVSLAALSSETQNYFKKLSGYDTLRMILARRAILVEGPSDELVVQAAYRKMHDKLPIQNGVDVINVRGISFLRFLEIAKLLGNRVAVVTDNDGNYDDRIVKKYHAYHSVENISIHADKNNALRTLELHLVECNSLDLLNDVLSTAHTTVEALQDYMLANKTDCALKLFEGYAKVTFPNYVNDACA